MDDWLGKAMVNQLCFSDTPRGNQSHVILIGQHLCDMLGFFHTVAEVFRTSVTVCDKRILHYHIYTLLYILQYGCNFANLLKFFYQSIIFSSSMHIVFHLQF